MANRTPEQDLINGFVTALQGHKDQDLCISKLVNMNCKSKTYADVEFDSKSGVRWVVEAKSHDSSDKHNTVHKVFGELLKETNRSHRQIGKHAILIPEDGTQFYSRAFQSINRDKFIGFGKLVPVDTVFTFGPSGIGQLSWAELYDMHKP